MSGWLLYLHMAFRIVELVMIVAILWLVVKYR
jgi:hypothetical protein